MVNIIIPGLKKNNNNILTKNIQVAMSHSLKEICAIFIIQ